MAVRGAGIPQARDLIAAIQLLGLRRRIALNRHDGSILVHVPEGEFEMGDGQDNDCPRHRVSLSAYWIGVYCVTNAQYLRFVQATGHRAPDQADGGGPPVWKGRSFPRERAEHPVVYVDWDDAQAYARWAGCELPTEAQWERAARGPQGLIYPWGKDWDTTRCRHIKNRGRETTCAVWGYPGGVSAYGTYNQAGNVSEWCADWYDEDSYGRSPACDPRGPQEGSLRVLRGGCWWYGVPGFFRCANRYWNDPGYRHGNQGFRLVRTASGSLPS